MRRLKDESGATMVLIAVLAVVLLGLTAFTIDAGAMYHERRQLQSGADAAVLAIAEDCATGAQPCNSSFAANTAAIYAADNAEDGSAAVQSLDLDTVAQTVTATVITEGAGGGTVLAPFFAQVLGFEGSTVGATATAAWGNVGSASTIPLIISDCEWFDQSRPELQDGPTYSGAPWLFVFHEGNAGRVCEQSNSGFDLPGGFGWLDTTSGCQAFLSVGAWASTDPGASPSNGCTPSLLRSQILNKPVLLPYYDDLNGTGNSIDYHVAAFGAFYIVGYNFGGGYNEPPANPPCSGSTRCLAGYFTTETISLGGFGGEDRGVDLIKLTN